MAIGLPLAVGLARGDLERLLGLGFTRQLPFAFATMAVEAHPAVAEFVREAA